MGHRFLYLFCTSLARAVAGGSQSSFIYQPAAGDLRFHEETRQDA